MTLSRATSYVHKDEKAMCLVERNLAATVGVHRYQVITVNRDGELADFTTDLGPVEEFTAPEFQVLGVWEHSVAELMHIADQYRFGDDHWQKFLAEKSAESTLIPDFLAQAEERARVFKNRTTVGPYLRKQRNGFSRKGALEWSKRR